MKGITMSRAAIVWVMLVFGVSVGGPPLSANDADDSKLIVGTWTTQGDVKTWISFKVTKQGRREFEKDAQFAGTVHKGTWSIANGKLIMIFDTIIGQQLRSADYSLKGDELTIGSSKLIYRRKVTK